MMKSFSRWLMEASTPPGNYVALKCTDMSDFWKIHGIEPPKTGEAPPNKDYHTTLIYSPTTKVNPKLVQHKLESKFDTIEYDVALVGADAFDSTPKDGERDSKKSCIVIKLDPTNLAPIHKFLLNLGLVHSYEEFSPHVTLQYNMDVEEAHKYKDMINSKLDGKTRVRLDRLYSQTIDKDYV